MRGQRSSAQIELLNVIMCLQALTSALLGVALYTFWEEWRGSPLQLRINQGVNQLLPGVNQLLPRNGHGYQLVTDDPAYNGYHYRYALSA